MNDFYITLPSNTNPGDTTANFSIFPPQKINLPGKWEVALVEIQYPHSWNNIYGNKSKTQADNWIDVNYGKNENITVFVPPGYYATIHELLDAIHYGKEMTSESQKLPLKHNVPEKTAVVLEKYRWDFSFLYDPTLKRVKAKLSPKIKMLKLCPKIQYMLGFDSPDIIEDQQLAKFNHDLRVGFYSLFIYCNLVEPQVVGNITAPLLRNVHIEGKFGDIVEKIYQTPHYVPVIQKEIDRIEIDIKDDNNQSVPFQFGKSVVKLHFRKKRAIL